MTPEQEARFEAGLLNARKTIRRVREYDPAWAPSPTISNPSNATSSIARVEAEAREAHSRLGELLRSAIPNSSPSWGVSRLRKELNSQGYIFLKPTDGAGYMYVRPQTGEQVRIMERPPRAYRKDPTNKHQNDYYYRYRTREDQPWGIHITVPNKASYVKATQVEVRNEFE